MTYPYVRWQTDWQNDLSGGTPIVEGFLDRVESSLVTYSTQMQIVLVYNTGTSSYPARPSGAPAGRVTYKGPVAPTDSIIPDTWEDTAGIWP